MASRLAGKSCGPFGRLERQSLTLGVERRKSQVTVPLPLTNHYAEFRTQSGAISILREDLESPPEHLRQGIWQHQRLLRDQMKTCDGQPVQVLHPGFRSVEGDRKSTR